jgi:large repetitive protein
MRHLRNTLVIIVAILTLFPATGFAKSLSVTWNADTDTDLAGYKVYYGLQSNTYGTPIDVSKTTSYQISNVQSGSTYYIAVTAYDTSGNESGKSSEMSAYIPIPDTTPPTGSVKINSGNATTSSSTVTLTLSSNDTGGSVSGMKISNDGVTYSNEVAYAASYQWTLSTGFGVKTVYVLFKDSSGNWMATPATATIQLVDATPPTGIVVINSGAPTTSTSTVTLTLNASDVDDSVTGMKFSNDGVTYSSEAVYNTSYQWTLSSGFGAKTVYVLFKDSSGNWMTSPARATIQLLDTTPPIGSILINSGAATTNTNTVTLTLGASDAGGSVTGMKFSNDGVTYSSEISYAASYSWTLSSGVGNKTVYALFKDNSGNWMTSPATSSIQLIDSAPPTGSVVINSGAATTSSTSVTLTLSANDAGGPVTGMKFSNDGVTYSSEMAYSASCSWTLTSGYGTKTVYGLFKDNTGNWMTSPSTATINYVNPLPISNAGANQNVPPQRVILDGSASQNPINGALQYSWTQVSGPVQVIIETPAASVASFMGIKAGVYQFKLTCSNGTGSVSATTNVTIQNVAPSVDAGSNVTIDAGTQITLHATGVDPNEDSLTYQWAKVSGSSVSIPSLAQQDITFTPTIAGQYTFSVMCYDGVNYSTAPQVIVTVNAVNHAPTANAGQNQNVYAGSTVTLDGSGSTDPDGDSLTYSWIRVSGPVQVTLSGASTATPTFVANTVGNYLFNLTVNDGKVSSTTSSVTITVLRQNNPPVANAGSDVHAYVGDDVVLNASSSYDPDGDSITFTWTQVSGASVQIFNASTAQPFFTPTTSGVFGFKVTVSDGQVSASDNVTVTVDNHNQVPIAVITGSGSNITAIVGSTVTLDGSKSYDPDGTSISYIWSQASGPAVSLSTPNSAKPSFKPTQTGTYVFQLKVYDGIDTSSPASVTVTVQTQQSSINLLSPVNGSVASTNPTFKWSGTGFKSYSLYASIDNGSSWTNLYNGSGTSYTVGYVWSFVGSKTTIKWYVQGTTTSGKVVKSSTGYFTKK